MTPPSDTGFDSEDMRFPGPMPAHEELLSLAPQRALLARMRSLLFQGWTQGPLAVDEWGQSCAFESPQACSWCLIGAARRAGIELVILGRYTFPQAVHAEQRVESRITRYLNREVASPMAAISWNEQPGRTQAEVLQLLAEVLAELEEQIADRCHRQPLAEPENQREAPEPARRELVPA